MDNKQTHTGRIRPSELKQSEVFSGDTPDMNALMQSLFPEADASDPRSIHYQRTLVRPAIRWGSLLINIVAALVLAWGIFFLARYEGATRGAAVLIATIMALGYGMARLKAITLSIVRLYQHYAPDYIRNKCRFEPSCSEYMILAVTRYGAWRGIRMGVHRLRRCNHDDGGYDWP